MARDMAASGVSDEEMVRDRDAIASEVAGGAIGEIDDVPEDVARLRDPIEQWKTLNPDEHALRSEVWIDEFTCERNHKIVGYETAPPRCPEPGCGEKRFRDTSHLDVHELTLSLAWTERDIHKRKVIEHVTHLANVARTEMTRLYPDARLTPEWVNAHMGVYEIALSSPATRQAFRETLMRLTGCSEAMANGIGEQGCHFGTHLLVNRRNEYYERLAKNSNGPRATASASAQATSTPS